MAHIFLSYARDDKAYVERILSDLHKAGHTSWYDKRAIQLGEDWQFAIGRGIADADVVLLALSFQAVKSEWVIKELEIAYGQHKLVFRLILEAISEESFPEVIRRTKANGVLLYKDYQEGLRKLLSDLRGASAGGRRIPFEVDHPRLPQFAGRDQELRELHRVLKQPGPSGIAASRRLWNGRCRKDAARCRVCPSVSIFLSGWYFPAGRRRRLGQRVRSAKCPASTRRRRPVGARLG